MQTILPGTMYPVRRNSQKKLSKLSSRLNKVGRLRMGHAKPAMIFTVLVLIYLTLGVIVLSCVAENWRIVDSLYFSMITLATVGYGDFGPTSDGSKIFLIIFVYLGLALIATALAVLGEWVLEKREESMEDAKKLAQLQFNRKINQDLQGLEGDQRTLPANYLRKRERSFFVEVVHKCFPMLAIVTFGAVTIGIIEKWSPLDAFYFITITVTTIGYGDITPIISLSRMLAGLVNAYISHRTKGEFDQLMEDIDLEDLLNVLHEQMAGKTKEEFVESKEDVLPHESAQTKFSENVRVTEADFLCFILRALDKVDNSLLQTMRNTFNKLDEDGNGILDTHDLKSFKIKMARRKSINNAQHQNEQFQHIYNGKYGRLQSL